MVDERGGFFKKGIKMLLYVALIVSLNQQSLPRI